MASTTDLPPRGHAPHADEGPRWPDPDRTSPLSAIRRHWFVFLLPVVLAVGASIAVAATRAPQYKATSSLAVLGVNLNTPGALGGFGTGGEQLAQAYARTMQTPEVLQAVSRRTGVPTDRLQGNLTALAVP